MMDKITQIREKVGELLASGEIDCFIGYEVGPSGRTRPVFVREAEHADRLIWGQACTHNLTRYLPELVDPAAGEEGSGRIGILVKPCDSRAIPVHLAERQYARENIYLLGVTCEGMREGAGYTADLDGELQPRCLECELSDPVLFDALIGEPVVRSNGPVDQDLETLEQVGAADRLSFWLQQFDRCIRCYACRQACPMCQCPTCLFERDDALWSSPAHRLAEKRAFHLGRAYHLAGRCVECDACQQACPMDIPIRMLNQKLAEVIQERFEHRAGYEPGASPLVTILRGEEVVG